MVGSKIATTTRKGKTRTKAKPHLHVRGDTVFCPQCGADAFVTHSKIIEDRTYPGFLGRRIRHRWYKCGDPACGHPFQRAIQIPPA